MDAARIPSRLLAIFLVSMLYVNVGAAADVTRFSLSGEGVLSIEGPAKTNGAFEVRASLAASAAPSVQSAGGFALMATLSTTSLVCYNDTIFRNDFDGDGF